MLLFGRDYPIGPIETGPLVLQRPKPGSGGIRKPSKQLPGAQCVTTPPSARGYSFASLILSGIRQDRWTSRWEGTSSGAGARGLWPMHPRAIGTGPARDSSAAGRLEGARDSKSDDTVPGALAGRSKATPFALDTTCGCYQCHKSSKFPDAPCRSMPQTGEGSSRYAPLSVRALTIDSLQQAREVEAFSAVGYPSGLPRMTRAHYSAGGGAKKVPQGSARPGSRVVVGSQ